MKFTFYDPQSFARHAFFIHSLDFSGATEIVFFSLHHSFKSEGDQQVHNVNAWSWCASSWLCCRMEVGWHHWHGPDVVTRSTFGIWPSRHSISPHSEHLTLFSIFSPVLQRVQPSAHEDWDCLCHEGYISSCTNSNSRHCTYFYGWFSTLLFGKVSTNCSYLTLFLVTWFMSWKISTLLCYISLSSGQWKDWYLSHSMYWMCREKVP